MPVSFSELDDYDALEAARVAATEYHHAPLIQLALHPDQGCSSLTFIAKYSDDTQSIIQLRDEPVNIGIGHLARTLLGDIIPIVVPLKATKTMHAYGQTMISGDRWEPLIISTVEDDTAISVQLANIFRRCNIHLKSGPIVDNYIIPRLDAAINLVGAAHGLFTSLPEDQHIAFLNQLKLLRSCANHLKVLDLVLCHVDPNPFNIIIDRSSPPKIKGLIDWGGATFLPFGMNAFEIRLIAVLNVRRHDEVTEAANPIALAFWHALVAEIPEEYKNAVLDSLEIGYVLFALFQDPLAPEGLEGPVLLREVELFTERMAWFEDVFRPLCMTHTLEGGT